jgi:hypothetical protein
VLAGIGVNILLVRVSVIFREHVLQPREEILVVRFFAGHRSFTTGDALASA